MLRDALSLDSLGQVPEATAPAAWPTTGTLDVLWSGGDAGAIQPLLGGLAGAQGFPRLTLVPDLKGALSHLKRQLPDLWVITLGSESDRERLAGHLATLDTPPIVVVLASQGDASLAEGLRSGGVEFITEPELTPVRLRELATRALARRRLLDDLAETQKRLEELVHRDALTGLYNRRYFETRLELECARAARFGEALTLVLLDVDHFKDVNDTYGHPVGDEVLVQIGKLLLGGVRSIDLVARVGGEEFALLLPNTGETGARGLVQRVIQRVRRHRFGVGGRALKVTLSAGLAGCPRADGAQPRALYEHADRALYLAKRRGRDRVEAFEADAS